MSFKISGFAAVLSYKSTPLLASGKPPLSEVIVCYACRAMATRNNPRSAELEELLADPQNLPEIARLMGQFDSEQAYRQFKANWEAAKPRAAQSAAAFPRWRWWSGLRHLWH